MDSAIRCWLSICFAIEYSSVTCIAVNKIPVGMVLENWLQTDGPLPVVSLMRTILCQGPNLSASGAECCVVAVVPPPIHTEGSAGVLMLISCGRHPHPYSELELLSTRFCCSRIVMSCGECGIMFPKYVVPDEDDPSDANESGKMCSPATPRAHVRRR